MLIGFEPGWHTTQISYALRGNVLTIGFDQWQIESLTDSTLTIFIPGFRRIKFISEEYLQNQYDGLTQVGEYNGRPLYRADRTISPHYTPPHPLRDDICKQDRADDYRIHEAGIFQISFIVTERGNIEDPKVLKSVAPGYDNNVIKELLKTSKQWSPAVQKGKPVQTLMFFEIQFLKSLQDY